MRVDQADAATELVKEVRATEEIPVLIDDPINIDEELKRFNAWLSWKLSGVEN
ncbi:hypothetical protein Dimus_005489 [Dionaea muscipula]